jgi:hypothetical protein
MTPVVTIQRKIHFSEWEEDTEGKDKTKRDKRKGKVRGESEIKYMESVGK